MAYCKKCGSELENDAKFCTKCGTSVTEKQNVRNIVYEGEIHKCPNCGEIIDSFSTSCTSCGFELRSTFTTTSINDFSIKLENASSDYQRANIIRNFPIPNNKEDIFEFLILASSNIDENPNKEVFNSWVSKIEQCYQKAKLSFKQENDFIKIQAIYEKTRKNIKKIHRKGPIRKILTIGLPAMLFIGLSIAFWGWVLFGDSEPVGTDKEIARLEKIVIEVEKALSNKEYDLAMMQAKSIDFFPNHESTSDWERQWDIKRDYLIKKIISEASKDGIIMEYPKDTVDEKDQSKNSYDYDYSQSKENIQKNLDKFNEYMNDVQNMWNQYTGDDSNK